MLKNRVKYPELFLKKETVVSYKKVPERVE
jgi:hypothetical protein